MPLYTYGIQVKEDDRPYKVIGHHFGHTVSASGATKKAAMINLMTILIEADLFNADDLTSWVGVAFGEEYETITIIKEG